MKCQHQSCSCEAPENGKYCSSNCVSQSAAEASSSGRCACGHPGCEANR